MAKPRRILIIDDDPAIIQELRLTLQGNYEVHEATGAQEGLQRLREVRPDLIILDLTTETQSEGLQVALALRSQSPAPEHAAFADTPILVLTTAHQATPLPSAPASGDLVDDVVEKPVKPGVLLAKVKRLLTSSR